MDAEGYAKLKKRVEKINHKRIEVKKELDMLKVDREAILSEITDLGIEDVSNLSTQITEWEQQMKEMETTLVTQVTEIEKQLEV